MSLAVAMPAHKEIRRGILRNGAGDVLGIFVVKCDYWKGRDKFCSDNVFDGC